VKKSDFCRELSKALAINAALLNQETIFKELDNFDSFSLLAIVAFMDEKFGKQLSARELQKIIKVEDLMGLIDHDFFD
jgi:acyl carrier protein